MLACSALKRSYRDLLRGRGTGDQGTITNKLFVLLSASEEELQKRVESRPKHFMPSSLIKSQLETLEAPLEGEELTVTIETDNCTIDDIVVKITDTLKDMK